MQNHNPELQKRFNLAKEQVCSWKWSVWAEWARVGKKMAGTAEEGYIDCGPSGAGRLVKMVHNRIAYGLTQAYPEGGDIFGHASSKELSEDQGYDLNLADIAEVRRRGSVVSSWLLDLTAMALAENPTLSEYAGVGSAFG
jgi:6-phosphogluconate dehydrogenase